MLSSNDKLNQSLQAGYINQNVPAHTPYLPQLLVNNKTERKKILSSIIQSLNTCEEFWFSVAFLTTSGVATLIERLIELEKKGVKGRILVSQYLNFTQPEALRRLIQFKNIELRIATYGEYHSKGFLFKKGELYDLIIGSSNLTAQALCTNIEWNLKITATPVSHIIFNAIKEFTTEYEKGTLVTENFIVNYEKIYTKQFIYAKSLEREIAVSIPSSIQPNSMQKEALESLFALRNSGKNKALLISATGTGKTYLSAFDVKQFNAKRVLFVVHRLNIANAALQAYQRILGTDIKMGIFSGQKKELEADFIFCTVQTISKEENLIQFASNHFDYIIIDETHRAGANSYINLINYFRPKFLLGMTATPERTDGFDIFKTFDYNIAYEIRLHRALEENLLAPFHYYGVTDITVNGQLLDENANFNSLTSKERIDRIIEKIKIYGCDDGNIRGLIFCSKKEECIVLSNEFNSRGYNTIALTSENSEPERTKAINQLESEPGPDKLDYIFTVDIFNEGIDIPSVNQIILLRPTQSAIIFVQQMGRGLRKTENKEYLTIIDFIGNYKNNFLVPIALYGDTSYNKDTLRKLITSGSNIIPGTSTINFDRIASERIFDSINVANMQQKRDLLNDYRILKFKLGRIPTMMDFIEHGSRDPFHYVNHSKSYFNFVQSIETSLQSTLNHAELDALELFSKEINNSKRVEDSYILHDLIKYGKSNIPILKKAIKDEFGYEGSAETIKSCVVNLNFEFVRKGKENVVINKDWIIIGTHLEKMLRNSIFSKFLLDSTLYSLETFRTSFNRKLFVEGLVRYNKYSRKDVCRILNWEKDISSTVFGYKTVNMVTPCFVTYHKSKEISETTNYNDHFIDQNIFAWESKSNRKISSEEIQALIKSKRILLFIKKDDREGNDFYFIGNIEIIKDSIKQDFMPNSNTPVVHFKFKIDHTVEDSIYHYLTSKIENIDQSQKLNPVDFKPPTAHPFRILDKKEIIPFKNCIPLFDIKVPAGAISEMQINESTEWVELNKPFKYSEDYFICQVVGESMNKVIPNGSWCLFKKDSGGTRNGQIVLVHQGDIQDPDFGRGYTIKLYKSKKNVNNQEWYHEQIILKPQSYDSKFKDIILTKDDLSDLYVRGIFVEVLK